MTAGELADRFNLSKATMSGHFAVLRAANLVDTDKQGTTITYSLRLSVLQDALLEFASVFGMSEDASAVSLSTEKSHAT